MLLYLLITYKPPTIPAVTPTLFPPVPGYPYSGSSVPVYYDGMGGGPPGMYYPPYNGPVVYNPPMLSVDDRTLQEYIKKQMLVIRIQFCIMLKIIT